MRTRNLTTVLVCLLAMLMISAGAWSGTWVEDFNDGDAEGWETRGGTWEVKDGQYYQSTPAGHHSFAYYNPPEAEDWKDYTLEFKINPEGGSNVGLAFRVQEFAPGGACIPPFNPPEGLMYMWTIAIGEAKGYSKLWKFRDGHYGVGAVALEATEGNGVPANKWTTLKVVVTGNTIKCYFNGQEEKSAVDDGTINGDVIPSGGIAIRTHNSTAYFDDVKISGEIIAGVEPALKLATCWGSLKLKN